MLSSTFRGSYSNISLEFQATDPQQLAVAPAQHTHYMLAHRQHTPRSRLTAGPFTARALIDEEKRGLVYTHNKIHKGCSSWTPSTKSDWLVGGQKQPKKSRQRHRCTCCTTTFPKTPQKGRIWKYALQMWGKWSIPPVVTIPSLFLLHICSAEKNLSLKCSILTDFCVNTLLRR